MPRTRAVKKSQIALEPEVDKERKEKWRMYMQEYDDQEKSHIQAITVYSEKLCENIKSACSCELLKIPKNIRKMTLAEFREKGGNIHNTNGLLMTLPLVEKFERENKVPKSVKRTTGKLSTKKHKRIHSANPQCKKSTRTRVFRSSSITEGDKRKTTDLSTPFTPKFDPRLPITPASGLRHIKLGEPVVLMSLQGSPLMATNDVNDVAISVSLEEGKMTLINSQMSLDSTDNNIKEKLQLIQEKLKTVVKPSMKS